MSKSLVWGFAFIFATFAATGAFAEAKPKKAPENTVEACADTVDNDGDGFIDCDDQDCLIFAICVKPQPIEQVDTDTAAVADTDTSTDTVETQAEPPPTAVEAGYLCSDGQDNDSDNLVDCQEPACQIERYCIKRPETGWLGCKDGVDNDGNGLKDCQEIQCQATYYCKKRIYYYPESEDKPQGVFLEIGGGLALPNWRGPTTAEVSAEKNRFNEDIPFKPDAGAAFSLQIGHAPLKWLGFGARWMAAATGATNRAGEWGSKHDVDYKYFGSKLYSYLGAFVRLQYIFGRFVPFVDLGAGYGYANYRWRVYPDTVEWDDIDDRDDEALDRENRYKSIYRHLTLAVEPGFNFFARKRSIAIGIKGFLPVYANHGMSTDNIGILLNVAFTPMWREKPEIKPEYANPASGAVDEDPGY